MFKTKIQSILLAVAIAVQALTPVALADYLSARAYAMDTVAGYASLLKTSMLTPAKDVVFVVERPDYSVVRISAQADLEGIAQADLYGHQTKVAGTYKVAVYYSGTNEASPQNSFTVYPDQVSTTQSMVGSTSQMLEADGESKSFVTVTLYDSYRNPIKDHHVQLISSRLEDKISSINTGITDDDGRASFKVTSAQPGISVYTALDASANEVLSDREEIVFYAPSPKSNGIGGNFLSTNMLQGNIIETANAADDVLPGPVYSFAVQDLTSTIKVNTDQTLTIVAKDKDGNVAKNYTGTVIISTPDDENAVLPNNGEYTFKEADQGKFTFSLALRFTQVGKQFIQILDKNDWKIAGELELEVVPQQTITTPNASSSLMIKSPLDGGEFGSNTVIISGQGDPNINLKVFDDDVKIGDAETDSDGFFTYQASNLAAGPHSFFMMSDSGQVSNTVFVNVDTLPPVLNYIDITPDGIVSPGANLNIVVNSESNLDSVGIRFQGIEKELFPVAGSPGSYSVSVAAPAVAGSFPVDVVLVDALANKSQLLAQKSILVIEDQVTLPSVVSNPEGIAGDGEVLLTWDKLAGQDTPIAKYKVYYSTDFDKLDKISETTSDIGSHKIVGLTNGAQHFFAVSAVDSKGNESTEKSVTIAVTPESDEPDGGVGTDGVIDESNLQGSANEQGGTGTETPVQVGPPASLYNNPLLGAATSNTATLSWKPFPGVNAAYYKVYFGLQPKQYDDYMVTNNNSTSFAIGDLINEVPYYFAVVALDFNGNEISPLSAEFTMTPRGSGFQSLPSGQITPSRPIYNSPLANTQFSKVPSQEDTGPEVFWLIGLSVVMAGGLYLKKKRLFS